MEGAGVGVLSPHDAYTIGYKKGDFTSYEEYSKWYKDNYINLGIDRMEGKVFIIEPANTREEIFKWVKSLL